MSPTSVWAYGNSSVAHWNGHSFKRTSLTRLLPKSSKLCGPGVLSAIDAVSASSVFAVGAADCPDGHGPLVLLHYNGKGWGQVGSKHIDGVPVGLINNGSGGLWIPMAVGAPESSFMEQYTNGTLSQVKLPIAESHLALFGAAIGTNTNAALTFGLSRKSFTAKTSTAVIMQFGS
jgi:hypothetical protein